MASKPSLQLRPRPTEPSCRAIVTRLQIVENLEALRRSIAAQPLFCVGLYRLGLAYERKREDSLASETLTRALETPAPGCNGLQDAFAARARVEQRLGNADSARADLERCAELSRKTESGKECSSMLQKFR